MREENLWFCNFKWNRIWKLISKSCLHSIKKSRHSHSGASAHSISCIELHDTRYEYASHTPAYALHIVWVIAFVHSFIHSFDLHLISVECIFLFWDRLAALMWQPASIGHFCEVFWFQSKFNCKLVAKWSRSNFLRWWWMKRNEKKRKPKLQRVLEAFSPFCETPKQKIAYE